MVDLRVIKGVSAEEVEKWRYTLIPLNYLIKFYWKEYKGREIYRAIDPDRLNVVIEKGTDRTEDYVSAYDRMDVIYAGNLNKALEYAAKYMRKKGRACISVYNGEYLEEVDIYTYRLKSGKSYKDALIGIVCIES